MWFCESKQILVAPLWVASSSQDETPGLHDRRRNREMLKFASWFCRQRPCGQCLASCLTWPTTPLWSQIGEVDQDVLEILLSEREEKQWNIPQLSWLLSILQVFTTLSDSLWKAAIILWQVGSWHTSYVLICVGLVFGSGPGILDPITTAASAGAAGLREGCPKKTWSREAVSSRTHLAFRGPNRQEGGILHAANVWGQRHLRKG